MKMLALRRPILGRRACFSSTHARQSTQARQGTRGLLTQAYASGPTQPSLVEQTVGEHFGTIVRRFGDRNAVISRHQNTIYTYETLDSKSTALARGLQKLGVKAGDRVAASLGNSIEHATLTYAVFKLGAVLVPLNPAFTTEQVVSALNHLTVEHLVIGLETNLPWKPPRPNLPLLEQVVSGVSRAGKLESRAVPSLRSVVVVDNAGGKLDGSSFKVLNAYSNVLEDGETAEQVPAPLQPSRTLAADDIINIQFTSGTTSMPKAACLSHRSILNNGKSIGDRMLLTHTDVVCCPPPLFHCFGCILGYMATVTHGAAIVFPTEAFNPEASLRAVQEYECTALYGVPTMFLAELELLAAGKVAHEGFQHLRTGIAAGSSVPAALMTRLHEKLNLTQLTICYGMTETSPVSLMTTTDDPLAKRVNTVGRLLPHVTAKIVDPSDRTRVLGVGEKGELAVAGYLLMKEYWGDRAKTEEAMVADEQGTVFMHTGDEAVMDEDGYVTITGRIKDIIIRGGENIHPLDIENCLLGLEGISDASVVGVADETYGEVVGVFVVRRKNDSKDSKDGRDGKDAAEGKESENQRESEPAELTEEQLKAYVRSKLPGHFVPKHVFWTGDLPKTASGKVQKYLLRAEANERVKQAEEKGE